MLFPDNSIWMEPPALSHPEAEEFQKAGQGRAELTLFFILAESYRNAFAVETNYVYVTSCRKPETDWPKFGFIAKCFFFFFKLSLMGGKV